MYMDETEQMEQFVEMVEELQAEVPEPAPVSNFTAFRAEVCKQDWTDDKIFGTGSNTAAKYPYLSADKVKRTVAGLLAKHHLEMEVNYHDLMKQPECNGQPERWTVMLTVRLTDMDTMMSMSDTVYGEAGDRADKGVSKAMTVALKNYWTQKYDIADGIFSFEDDHIGTGSFKPRSAEDAIEIKSQIASNALPKPPAQKPSMPPAQKPPMPAPKAQAPKEEPKEEVKEDVPQEPVKEVAEPPAPKENKPKYEIKGVHKEVIARMLSEGRGREDYDDMQAAYEAIDSQDAVVEFIRTYGVR